MNNLTASQSRLLGSLSDWMENFFCNETDRTDGMVFALDNGWKLHAADCMAGTGATDKRFDRVYSALVRSIGQSRFFELSRKEAREICAFARIQICTNCNSHAFTDPSDNAENRCGSCLKPFETEEESEGSA